MEHDEVMSLLERTGALLRGHFLLSSGLHSDTYVQCALATRNPGDAALLCGPLAEKFVKKGVEVVAGPALGGIIPAYEVARALGVPAIFGERVDGIMTLRRGFSFRKGERVLIIEDVITTGGSAAELAELAARAGAEVVGIGCIVNRSKGARMPAPVTGLIDLDLPAFSMESCPLCTGGSKPVKPGSRQKITGG